MSTQYSEIYDLYSGMTNDYEHLSLPLINQDEILEGWLLVSIGEFTKCKIDLSDRDDMLKQFNQILTDEIKVILAKGILKCWLSPKLYNIDNLKNTLASKDFNQYSPANLLKEIRQTFKEANKDFKNSIGDYKHKNFNPLTDLLQR